MLLVVAYHAGVPGVTGGYVGVDVFFVLSGFLITGLLLRELRSTGTISLRDFYARRVRRLLPVSALVLLTTALASLVLLPPLDRGTALTDVSAAALYVANWHFALTDAAYTAPTGKSPVLHLWSLSVEEQFYVAWPLLLLAVTAGIRSGRRRLVVQRRVALALAVLGVVSLALSAQLSQGLGPWAYYGLHTRAWELAAGAALALVAPRLRGLPRELALIAGWVGVALVVLSAVVLDEDTAFPGTAAALPVAGTALLVAAGAGLAGVVGVGVALSGAVPRYLGRISYAWYLWHWPCLVLLAGVGRAADEEGTATTAGASRVLLAVAVSFVLAALTNVLVETPVRTSRWLSADRRRSLTLGAVLTAAVALVPLLPVPGPAGVAGGSTAKLRTGGTVTLRQTPAQARSDHPRGTEGCYSPHEDLAVEPCRYGSGDRTVVLLGDSHAEQWFPAFRRAAQEQGWTLHYWAKPLCPATSVLVYAPRLRGPYPACSTWREEVLRTIAALPEVDAVVLARRGEYGDRLAGPDGRQLPVDAAGPLWEEGTRTTVETLTAATPRVVLLGATPRPGRDVPSCLSEAERAQDCSFGLDVRPARAVVEAAEDRVIADVDAVRRLDVTGWVCPADPCDVVSRDGDVVFRDGEHLTATFSASLAGRVGRELGSLLPQR